MKKFCFLIASLGIVTPIYGAYNGLLERADEQYFLRDYSSRGISSAADARFNYEKVAKKLMSSIEGQYSTAGQLRANHFVCQARGKDNNDDLLEGFSIGQRSSIFFDNNYGKNLDRPTFDERAKKIFADVMVHHAMNTREWIKSSGSSYPSEWKKIEKRLDQIIQLGQDFMADFGVYQVRGLKAYEEGNFKLAEKNLELAFKGTLVPERNFSRNGIINYYYAQSLIKNGQAEKGRQILQGFAHESIENLSMAFLAENKFYQKKSFEFLNPNKKISRPKFVPNEFVVKLTSKNELHHFYSLARNLKAKIKEEITEDILLIQAPFEAISQFKNSPEVEIIEHNYLYYSSEINRDDVPNDPKFSDSWGMYNYGQVDLKGFKGIAGVDVQALDAWKMATGSKDIVVAVIDTGVDFTHPDLKENAWTNEAEFKGKSGVDDDGNGFVDDVHGYDFVKNSGELSDLNGHGTHVSGVIGAKGNDSAGIAGINWNVRIMGVRFLDANGGGTLDGAIKAVKYSIKMGAKISNNSWGGGEHSEILKNLICEGGSVNDQLFVAAAGNSGENSDHSPEYPAAYNCPNIISVAAVDNRGRLANFSNYGFKNVHIAAPGQNILSTLPGNKFEAWSGTSMAAPFVSGIAALVQATNPNLNYHELKTRLLKTSAPLASLRGKVNSEGMINAYHALTGKSAPQDPNDPADWNQEARSISTIHSYAANTDKLWEIKISGAKKISLHFEKFELESGYDRLYFLDQNKNVIGVWTDKRESGFSPIVDGDTMFLRFVSDKTIHGYGFDIDSIGYK